MGDKKDKYESRRPIQHDSASVLPPRLSTSLCNTNQSTSMGKRPVRSTRGRADVGWRPSHIRSATERKVQARLGAPHSHMKIQSFHAVNTSERFETLSLEASATETHFSNPPTLTRLWDEGARASRHIIVLFPCGQYMVRKLRVQHLAIALYSTSSRSTGRREH